MKKTIIILSALLASAVAMPTLSTAANKYPEFPKTLTPTAISKLTDEEKAEYIEAQENAKKQLVDDYSNGKYDWDLNLDGKVDAADAHCIGWYFLELATNQQKDVYYDEYYKDGKKVADEYQFTDAMRSKVKELADIDGDGKINTIDETYMLYAVFKANKDGDVNCDGLVDARDASNILEFYAGNSTNLTASYAIQYSMKYLGDLNGDEKADASDASKVLSIYSENSTKALEKTAE